MLMPHESRIIGKRRRALGHFRSKLGLAYLDSNINKILFGVVTDRGNEDTHATQRTDFILCCPHMEHAQETWYKDMEKGDLVHVPREPELKSISQ